MKDSGRQKDRQRWERKEWASLVEKHPRRVKASPWGLEKMDGGQGAWGGGGETGENFHVLFVFFPY